MSFYFVFFLLFFFSFFLLSPHSFIKSCRYLLAKTLSLRHSQKSQHILLRSWTMTKEGEQWWRNCIWDPTGRGNCGLPKQNLQILLVNTPSYHRAALTLIFHHIHHIKSNTVTLDSPFAFHTPHTCMLI